MTNCPRRKSGDQFESANKPKTYGFFDNIANTVRTLVALTVIGGAPAVVGGCAVTKGNVKIEKPPRQQGIEAFDRGRFLLAWRKLSEIPESELTEDDKGIMEDIKNAILKEIEESLKKGKEAEGSGNYTEALQYYERACDEMDQIYKNHPKHQEATEKLIELEKKIAEYKKNYFQIRKGLNELFKSGNYIALAYAIDHMDEIRASLNYDEALEKNESLSELCLKIADRYLKKFEYKEALIFFRLAQELLLPGQSIPEDYKAKSFAAKYRHEKKLGMQKMTTEEKVNTLVAELKASSNEERKIELAIIIASLEPKNKEALKILKKKGISINDVLRNGGVVKILADVDGIEIAKPTEPRRRWKTRSKRRKKVAPKEVVVDEEKLKVDDKIAKIETLMVSGQPFTAIVTLNRAIKEYKKSQYLYLLLEIRKEFEPVKKDLVEEMLPEAKKAFLGKNVKEALRLYNIILQLDPKNKIAKERVQFLSKQKPKETKK